MRCRSVLLLVLLGLYSGIMAAIVQYVHDKNLSAVILKTSAAGMLGKLFLMHDCGNLVANVSCEHYNNNKGRRQETPAHAGRRPSPDYEALSIDAACIGICQVWAAKRAVGWKQIDHHCKRYHWRMFRYSAPNRDMAHDERGCSPQTLCIARLLTHWRSTSDGQSGAGQPRGRRCGNFNQSTIQNRCFAAPPNHVRVGVFYAYRCWINGRCTPNLSARICSGYELFFQGVIDIPRCAGVIQMPDRGGGRSQCRCWGCN